MSVLVFFACWTCAVYCSPQSSGLLHLTISPVGPRPPPNHSLASSVTALALDLGITEADLI